jgi:hypothetical protein
MLAMRNNEDAHWNQVNLRNIDIYDAALTSDNLITSCYIHNQRKSPQ